MNTTPHPIDALALAAKIERLIPGDPLAAELRRLHIVEQEFQQWMNKTEWVQKSAQSHELGMHRADVLKQRIDCLVDGIAKTQAEIAELKFQLESVGAGGVGPLMPPASSNHSEQYLGMVPAGWNLVPVDLTKEMQAAGEAAWAESYSQYKNGILHGYRAMLAAAPRPPANLQLLREPLTDGDLKKLKPKPAQKGWIYTEAQMEAYARKVERAHGIGGAV